MGTYKVYFANAGVPETGLTLSWEYLKKVSDGNDEGSPPSFNEVGGGWYKFDYSPSEDMVGVIDGSNTLEDTDRYVSADFTANDFALSAVKTKTDQLNFTGDDVKATLDGEEVTTDSASRIASKADVSSLATSAALTVTDGVADAIKTVTDRLNTMISLDGAVYQFTDNALELAVYSGINPSDTVDGSTTYAELFKYLLANIKGSMVIDNSAGTLEYKDQDGNSLFTLSVTSTARSAS